MPGRSTQSLGFSPAMSDNSEERPVARFMDRVFGNYPRAVTASIIGGILFVLSAGVSGVAGHIVGISGWTILAFGFIGLSYQGIQRIWPRK